MAISNNSTGLRPGVCTSTTRPTAPYEGQHIYETDTDLVYLWNGSAWVETVSALTKAPRGVMAYNSSTTADATISSEEVQLTGSSFTAVTGRLYKISYFEPDVYSNTSSSYISMRIRLTNISGTVLQETFEQSEVGGVTNRFMHLVWVGTLTAGSTNVVGTLAFNVGTATASRGSTVKSFLIVEDIGAA